ncbi:unnamed protein product [Blepharisma stoltei]|uniref:Ycf1 n=1 Tax=Blepharisma stoltei TaxID=1481888 RepID=A0AAU9J2K5_9CILI|nr:unnamed protein product [Blepharisma stoltei]
MNLDYNCIKKDKDQHHADFFHSNPSKDDKTSELFKENFKNSLGYRNSVKIKTDLSIFFSKNRKSSSPFEVDSINLKEIELLRKAGFNDFSNLDRTWINDSSHLNYRENSHKYFKKINPQSEYLSNFPKEGKIRKYESSQNFGDEI